MSMGLGPINAIYQAQFNRYLHNRGIKDTSEQHVWAFLGDGEMDEPESPRRCSSVAANEGLDNLTFVINCNLQRLDGPVRGNGKIIQELEAFFRGAGWNVIKVIWGREWDPLLAADTRRRAGQPDEPHAGRRLPDLQGQRRRLRPRALLRPRPAHRASWSRTAPTTRSGTSSAAATTTARSTRPTRPRSSTRASRPSSSRKTIKGYGLGPHFEGRNATHQMKKLTLDDLKQFRDELQIPITRRSSSRRTRTCRRTTTRARTTRRSSTCRSAGAQLGGYVPERRRRAARRSSCPDDEAYDDRQEGLRQAGDRHHDGVRPAAQGPHAGQGLRQPRRADHPRRGPHVRHGLVLPDGEDLQPARPALHLGRPRAAAGLQGEPDRARSSTSASTRPARSRRSPRSARRTRRTASR